MTDTTTGSGGTPKRKPRATTAKPAARQRGRTTPQRVDTKERAKKALELRLRRHSYDEIAAKLGFNDRSAARKAVEREIALIPREPAMELRQQELETLDAMQRKLMPQVLGAKPGLWAIDRVLAIMDKRAKYTGLYENLTDSGVDEFKAALKAWAMDITKQVEQDEPVVSDEPVADPA